MAMELSTINTIMEVESNHETKKVFVIKTLSNAYYFRAENGDIMNKWKDELMKLTDRNNDQDNSVSI